MWNYRQIKNLPSFCHCFGFNTHSSSEKKKKVGDNVSGIELYLLIEQPVVLSQTKIICLLVHPPLAYKMLI